MQKIFYSIIVLILSATVFAQAPQSFKYQAVARDADGNNITNLSYLVNDQDAATKIYIDQMKAEIFTQIAGGKVTDYDGNSYNTVKIGNKIWMAENLNYTTGYGSWCYDDKESNCNTYGRLYNWETAKKVCPDGWHLPTDEEWKELEMYLGMSQADVDNQGWRGINEGSKLAGNKNLWQDGILENDAEFGTSGFTALPGGLRYHYSSFRVIGNKGELWSATEYNTDRAWYRSLRCYYSSVYRFYYYKECGFSVRCVRDD